MKYINPGLAELLDVDGGTTIESNIYNPVNGVALYQPDNAAGIDLPPVLSRIYGRFDIYIPSPSNNTETDSTAAVGVYGQYGFHGVRIVKSGSTYYKFYVTINGSTGSSTTYYSTTAGIKYDAVNTVSFYVKGRSDSARDWRIHGNLQRETAFLRDGLQSVVRLLQDSRHSQYFRANGRFSMMATRATAMRIMATSSSVIA